MVKFFAQRIATVDGLSDEESFAKGKLMVEALQVNDTL